MTEYKPKALNTGNELNIFIYKVNGQFRAYRFTLHQFCNFFWPMKNILKASYIGTLTGVKIYNKSTFGASFQIKYFACAITDKKNTK